MSSLTPSTGSKAVLIAAVFAVVNCGRTGTDINPAPAPVPAPVPDASSAADAGPPDAVIAKRVFVGSVYTMDATNAQVEAVAVDARGVIVATGTKADVLRRSAGSPQIVELAKGQVLLPGFIEPHMHLNGQLQLRSGITFSLEACRPAPYADNAAACSTTILEGLNKLRAREATTKRWLLGLNVDPSRQAYDASASSTAFRNDPATLLARDLSALRPTLIVDQSGHLAYVNRAAFDELEVIYRGAGKAWPPVFTHGGAFVKGTDPSATGNAAYTGLLQESEAFAPFVEVALASYGPAALALADMTKYVQNRGPGVVETLSALRARGVTTAVSIADDATSVAAAEAFVRLPEAGVRVSSLVFPAVALSSFNGKPLLATCDPRTDSTCALPRSLGVTGIKLTADGSTQGCSAGLAAPVLYVSGGASGGECAPPEGRLDFTSDYMYNALLPLWTSGLWRFETHANGNGAIKLVVETYARLQQTKANPHRAVVIHATVGDESVWKEAGDLRSGSFIYGGKPTPALDVRMTHLVGHVAYWGAAFERQLGAAAAANIDPFGFDAKYGIPFTLHSDATVTPTVPLWFVRQAVTRVTWTYPDLKESHVLGPEHRISVLEAFRAITSRAAQEKELDGWLGSLEVGKVADFVVLSEDPFALDTSRGGDPTHLSDIGVVDTYLNGERTMP